jgi:soluble lytic murein transglycosylase-like protein
MIAVPAAIPAHCIQQAAYTYQIPIKLLQAIIKVEGGRVGVAAKNRNGSVDYGPMQINSLWQPQLQAYGINPQRLQYDACTNIWVGAWILRQKLQASTNFWQAVANYHSTSLVQNLQYQQKLRMAYYS